ncbi:hypothetical protein F4821DRAFT_67706 [Hypoxylon rubiginosum]|uniref:Uncharacterized protein n=1 Tax=Hypoxylon rubiginosum TaxID=110542 RepID=A0ACC0CIN5_9PEZI|nr:hypothetical protein F4821DRAFT_67706 [Hypoxylon rubiginosum]
MLAFLHHHASDQLRKVCGKYDIAGFVAAIPCTYGKSAQQRYEHLLGRAGWPIEVLQWVWEPEAVGFSALVDAPILRNLSREKSGVAVLVIDLGGLTCDAVGHAIEPCGPRAEMHLTREIALPVGHFGGSGMARYVFEGWIAQHYPDLRQHIDQLFHDFWDRAMVLEKAEHMNLTHLVDIPLEQVQGILDAVFDGVFAFFEKQLTPILHHRTWDVVVLYGGTSQSEFVKARLRPLFDQYEPLILIDNLPEQATVVSRGALECFLAASKRIENIAHELAAVSLGIRVPDGMETRAIHPLKTQGVEFQDIDQRIVPFSLQIEQDVLASFTHNLATTSLSLAFCYREQASRSTSGRNLYPDYVDMDEIRVSIAEAAAKSIEQYQFELSRNHTCVTFGVSCHPCLATAVDLVVWYKLPPRMKGSWREISRQAYRFTIDPGSGRILLEGV